MSSNIFIKKNLDLLLTSIESLDPYVLDDLILMSQIDNIIDLFKIRNENCMRYKEQLFFFNDHKSLIILQKISHMFNSVSIQKNIIFIFQEYIDSNKLSKSSGVEINNYLKRFEINYRKSMMPYLLGKINYNSSNKISDHGLIYLFILYKINSSQGIYMLLLFLILKNTTIFSYIPRK
jgi:hypothetical protein